MVLVSRILIAAMTLCVCVAPITAQPESVQRGSTPVDQSKPVATANSVGKLWIPSIRYKEGHAQHFTEQCSATLVTTSQVQTTSRFLLSAWHCIEDYQDLSKTIYFESSDGQKYASRIVASGGGMYSDWALLRLSAPLSPVAVLTESASMIGDPLEMAGFPRSANSPPATSSWNLKIEHCHATARDARDWSSDCVLTRGASGGAVLDSSGRYLGVISRGDGSSQSIFVATSRFRSAINRYLP